MIINFKHIIKPYVANYRPRKLEVQWAKKSDNSWLEDLLPNGFTEPKPSDYSLKIERYAQLTNQKGPQPIWEGYKQNNKGLPTRCSNDVRTEATIGRFFTYLVEEKKPNTIVEIGTAFGVSGMYFLAGLNKNNHGKLLTFDPNKVWTDLARENLSKISDRFELTVGTFEDHIDAKLSKNECIDIAFIDAIHTKQFVVPQLELVLSRAKKGSIIILDDINFSENMSSCWHEISLDPRFICSAKLNNRVGLVEVG
ncbi:O-methyltransferase [Fulvivirga sediminis]|uniref:Class I SAM-dependent methyltransferase n=1 Tax=Fulvivirga sediminis TaxID=2803949 RepID=A0A937F1D8_9BACT|nr:class I SAM-dependent methyltransferase [Fulvivirga sediminis]MBL3654497.1 class I SAM-dependent methyltransferase [Fulvivirga sediminis]